MGRTIDLVVNPRAGGGRAAKVLDPMRQALANEGFTVHVHPTERPGHAGSIVRGLLRKQAELIGVMGGDGSFHEALAGLRSEEGTQESVGETAFAVIPAGTGGDLRKTLGVPEAPAEVARFLRETTAKPFDLGEISYVSDDGNNAVRYFGNIASAGIGGVVDRLVAEGPKWLGGKVAYFSASFRGSLGYRNVPMRVVVDDQVFFEGAAYLSAVCNGRYFGGGMLAAPEADVRDGIFDVLAFGDLTIVEALRMSPHLYKGTHLSLPKMHHTRGKTVRITALSSTRGLLDLDGESPGRLDATFTIKPSMLRVHGI